MATPTYGAPPFFCGIMSAMIAKEFLLTAAEAVLDFLFAPRCAVCDVYIEHQRDVFCPKCRADIISIGHAPEVPNALSEVWRITRYHGGSREMLRALKFNEGRRADEIAQLNSIKRVLELAVDRRLDDLIERSDMAVPVPLHANRQSERGFNQVELIFNEWLRARGLKVESALRRVKDTKHLFDLNREERRAMLEGAFALVDGVSVEGKRILLLDDIFTTGATMGECARVLRAHGAAEVNGLVLAADFAVDE